MSLEAWGDEPWGAEDESDIERLLGKGYRSADDMTRAAHDVIDERLRQRDVEGWTPEHDDAHRRGEMAMAAVSYATNAVVRVCMAADGYPADKLDELSAKAGAPRTWPWSPSWWKPAGGARRILVKAAALLLAEIERIDRAEAQAKRADP